MDNIFIIKVIVITLASISIASVITIDTNETLQNLGNNADSGHTYRIALGNYYITDTVNISTSNIEIVGEYTSDYPRIFWEGDKPSIVPMFKFLGVQNVTLSSIAIKGANDTIGLYIDGNITVHRCLIYKFKHAGLKPLYNGIYGTHAIIIANIPQSKSTLVDATSLVDNSGHYHGSSILYGPECGSEQFDSKGMLYIRNINIRQNTISNSISCAAQGKPGGIEIYSMGDISIRDGIDISGISQEFSQNGTFNIATEGNVYLVDGYSKSQYYFYMVNYGGNITLSNSNCINSSISAEGMISIDNSSIDALYSESLIIDNSDLLFSNANTLVSDSVTINSPNGMVVYYVEIEKLYWNINNSVVLIFNSHNINLPPSESYILNDTHLILNSTFISTPTDSSPETPPDTSPETPTDPSPETPTDPSPETPADTSPETPAPIIITNSPEYEGEIPNSEVNSADMETDIIILISALGGLIILTAITIIMVVVIKKRNNIRKKALLIVNSPVKSRKSSSYDDVSSNNSDDGITYNDTVNIKMSKSFRMINIDHLNVKSKIGEGGFGEVSLAIYNNKKVAVKYPFSLASRDKVQFLEECKTLISIPEHKNIVKVVGYYLNPLMIVTDFMEGGSLDTFVQRQKLSNKQFLDISIDIAKGMKHLHECGIIHRDLAARNVLLDNKMNARISDFGLARLLVTNEGETQSTGGVPLLWMPPESLKNKTYSKPSDVWSYGIVLWEMLTGKQPFGCKEPEIKIAHDIMKFGKHPDIPSNTNPQICDILSECWNYDSKLRPSFLQILDMLTDIKRKN